MKWIEAAVISTLAQAVLGCLPPDFEIYLPQKTDHYRLPGNHIPTANLAEVTVASTGGVTVAGFLARQNTPSVTPSVLFLHGVGGNLDNVWDWPMRLWDRGYNVLIIDYRGFGRSTGSPSEQGLYDDAASALSFLMATPSIDNTRIVLWGFSLGSAVASELATIRPPTVLVLESPFTSMVDMVELSSPYSIPAAWVTDARFDTYARIGDISAPVVVAHGTDDHRVPYWMGEKVFGAAHDPKIFVCAQGAGHETVFKTAAAQIFAAISQMADAAVP